MIKENISKLLSSIPKTNPFGEEIVLVGATKTRSVEEINQAISFGLTDIGENKAQEFRDKFPFVLPCNYHFFGRLQKNKVKYLIGKCYLIQSVDSVELAKEISSQSQKLGVTTNILIEVNQGEENKGGFQLNEVIDRLNEIKALPNLKVKGLMSVMPFDIQEKTLRKLCGQTRSLYDIIKKEDENFSILSMGMSSDYQIAIECGSNMIRVGEKIFGKRDYGVK